MSNRLFTSWVRRGAAGAIAETDPASGPWATPATFQPSVILTMNGAPQPALPGPALPLLGPGAVTGLSSNAIVRTDPAPGATGVEDNYLVQIEFTRADLPWMFTPAKPNAANRLRPWLVLIVLDASTVQLQPGTPLPSVSVNDSVLPDLNDSWGWAHAQVTVDDPATAAAELIPASGTSAIARLMCPMKLQPDTAYLACVVPATLPGVKAGLGLPPDAGTTIAQAWTAGSGQDVILPVYYSWQFSTGDDGDFKSLVGRLQGVSPTSLTGFGIRTVDISNPWQQGAQLDPGTTFGLGGALGTGGVDQPLTGPDQTTFETRLTTILNFPADLQSANAAVDPSLSAVAPPIYGGRHAGAIRVPTTAGWLQSLNLDPRRRIAAAFGTQFVQENQEFLMAQAWNQLGAVQDANRLQALAELAGEVGDRMHQRHIATLDFSTLASVAAPARTRVLLTQPAGPALTLQATTAASPVPAGASTVAYRRFSRPLGPLGKRVFVNTQSAVIATGLIGNIKIAPALQDGLVSLTPAPAPPTTTDPAANLASRGWQAISAIEKTIPPPNVAALIAATNTHLQTPPTNPQGLKFGPPILRVLPILAAPVTPALVNTISAAVAQGLTPSVGIFKRFQARVQIPAGLSAGSSARVMAGPQFTAPIGMALINSHPDWLVPGLGNFPDNRVTVLVADGAFVESFLAGANQEMNRELLWREYPTDQRGTPFRYFWPRPGGVPDIPPITNWQLTTPLGSNGANGQVEDLIVFVVRGDLIHRYPRMIVYAAPAKIAGTAVTLDADSAWPAPQFALKLDDRTTAFAYNLNPADIKSDLPNLKPGYYFVFSEPLTGPRFDFGATPAAQFQQWTDLDWSRVPQSRGFAVAGTDLAPPPGENLPTSPRWNNDAADIARIAFARPYRVGFHADELLAGVSL